jgi:hypothetical protein
MRTSAVFYIRTLAFTASSILERNILILFLFLQLIKAYFSAFDSDLYFRFNVDCSASAGLYGAAAGAFGLYSCRPPRFF